MNVKDATTGTNRPARARLTIGMIGALTALLALLVGGSGAAQAKKRAVDVVTPVKLIKKRVSFSSGNLALHVPDPGSSDAETKSAIVRSPIDLTTLPSNAKIKDVNVKVRVTADSARDVEMVLASPAGPIELSSDNGNSFDDYGSGAADCSGKMTVFDSDFDKPVTGGAAPFADRFAPEESLDILRAMKGSRAKSQPWVMLITDDDPGGAVTLDCWKIKVKYKVKGSTSSTTTGTGTTDQPVKGNKHPIG